MNKGGSVIDDNYDGIDDFVESEPSRKSKVSEKRINYKKQETSIKDEISDNYSDDVQDDKESSMAEEIIQTKKTAKIVTDKSESTIKEASVVESVLKDSERKTTSVADEIKTSSRKKTDAIEDDYEDMVDDFVESEKNSFGKNKKQSVMKDDIKDEL